MIFGVAFYSYMVGNIIQIIEKQESDNQETQNKLDTLRTFQKISKINKKLYYRIKRHIENNQIQKKFQESGSILQDIPSFLREKVVEKTHGAIFKKISFFKERIEHDHETDHAFISAIVHELKPINLSKNEILYQQNDASNEIYFIQ
jgi:hypothetical protein